jgi:glyoxylase-like metal-dependent hydrolase (beta-lactamase superfamily II)
MINKMKNNVFQLDFRLFGSCVYIIILGENKVMIDTGSASNSEELIDDLNELKIKPEEINIILLTHRHWDHTGNLSLFKNAEVYDSVNIDELTLEEFEVIRTPGHTKDGLCFLYGDVLFSGDTIFHDGGRGRTDLEGGDEEQIQKSIKKLKGIDYNVLCPGHVN